MLKSLLYKNLLLLKKYYLWLVLGLLLMNYTLPSNIMVIILPFVLFAFQGICINATIQNDYESKFQEYAFASVGEKKYIDSIYCVTITNIILSLVVSVLLMYHVGISAELIKLFLSVQVFVYSLFWSIQLPLSYSKDISVFQIGLLMMLIIVIVILFGLGAQYYGAFLVTLIKSEPGTWAHEINIEFHSTYALITVLLSSAMLCISRYLLSKSTTRQERDNT